MAGGYPYCYLYEYSDAYCNYYQTSNYVNTYYCHPGDATDDGYVTDDGNQYTSQQLILQQGFPVPLPGNSTTIRFVLVPYLLRMFLIISFLLAHPFL